MARESTSATNHDHSETTGQLSSMSTPAATGQGITSYTYGANGEPSTVADPFTNRGAGCVYDGAGRLAGRVRVVRGAPVPGTHDAGGMIWSRGYEPGTGLPQVRLTPDSARMPLAGERRTTS